MSRSKEPKGSEEEDPKDKPARRSRRVTVAGTGLSAADGPEPRVESVQPERLLSARSKQQKLSERDRWMLDQKPPHY